ncbi:UNKNOWN [Stylonychia lemnae]|uniref:Uncharacterized protein n=1 Tax=Stylonychia lemnae TaxID=5949 RepID=A0A078AGY9_STYLE|nr:UNKNOWN [Stylonychia lemnae]|eukprot:CDW81111.1 UNKNOWN [Stylonychia lemnae]
MQQRAPQKQKYKALDGKHYIFKAGWEFQKEIVFGSPPNGYLDYVYIYKNWDDYTQNMTIHIWDFIIRYCYKFLRYTREDLTSLNQYLKVVKQYTCFRYSRGKVMPWTAAILFFFSNVYLKKLEITIDKILQVIQMPNLKDFKKCYEYLKVVFIQNEKQNTYPNVDQILYEVLKELNESHKVTVIRECSNEISKKILTEYIFLSFLNQTPQNQNQFANQDYIACILAIMIAFDLYGAPQSIEKLILLMDQLKPELRFVIKVDDIIRYYGELYPDVQNLIPAWIVPRSDFKELTKPEKVKR